jgi:hypothetical protein
MKEEFSCSRFIIEEFDEMNEQGFRKLNEKLSYTQQVYIISIHSIISILSLPRKEKFY